MNSVPSGTRPEPPPRSWAHRVAVLAGLVFVVIALLIGFGYQNLKGIVFGIVLALLGFALIRYGLGRGP